MTEWIKSSDQLPEKTGKYLGYIYPGYPDNECTIISQVNFNINMGWQPFSPMFAHVFKVTHWMELPEPPKEKNHVEYLIKALEFRILYGIWPPNSPCNELDYKDYIKSILLRIKND